VSAQANLVKENFGGKLIQQVISRECPHISEREEDFFALQVRAAPDQAEPDDIIAR
jgi:hypothetical protein